MDGEGKRIAYLLGRMSGGVVQDEGLRRNKRALQPARSLGFRAGENCLNMLWYIHRGRAPTRACAVDRHEFGKAALSELEAVYRLAYHLAPRADDADELVQET